jgi:MFS family permease
MKSPFFGLLYGVPAKLRANFAILYWDIAVWGLYTGSQVVFLSVYAVRAGATGEQIALMNAGPALVSLLASLPAGLLARRFPAKTSVVVSAFLARVSLLAYVLIPTLVLPGARVDAIVAVTILLAFPNTLLGICFGPFFLKAVPGEWRGTVVGVRNALMSIVSFFVTLLCGQLLVRMDFPAGYQVVFFIGFVGAVLSIYTLAHVAQFDFNQPPHAHAPESPSAPAAPRRESLRERIFAQRLSFQAPSVRAFFPRRDPAGRHYVVVLLMLFGLNAAGYMGAPLMPLFTVNTLRLNDAVISVGSAANSMLVFVVSLFVARLTRRFGNRRLTAVGAALMCFQLLALALAQDAALFVVASIIGGIASGVLMAASFNWHLDNVPKLDQTAWISWNSLLGNVAALLGSVIGPAVAGVAGIPLTLAGLGLVRLFIAAAIYLWG